MYKVLIVVDMQNDFIDGVLGSKEAQKIVPKVVDKINEGWDAIIYTLDTHDSNYENTKEGKHVPKHCIFGTTGHELNPLVKEAIDNSSKTTKIKKVGKSKFGAYLLYDFVKIASTVGGPGYIGMHPLTEVTLIGLCTDICVISNALLLNAHANIPIKVDAKCCAGTTPENHRKAIDIMKQCLIEVEE